VTDNIRATEERTPEERPAPRAWGDRAGAPEGDRGRRRRPQGRFPRRKVCPFCAEKQEYIDFKDVARLRKFVTDRGKLLPRRITGVCAKHQRALTTAAKRARHVALLPFKSS
jgi:small subunit ribosomal protein S18